MIADLFVYIVTIVGVISLASSMLEFKYKKWIQISVLSIIVVLFVLVEYLSKKYIPSNEAGTYYSVNMFADLVFISIALIILSKDQIFVTTFAVLTQLCALMIICYISYMIASFVNNNRWIEGLIRALAFLIVNLLHKYFYRKVFRDFVKDSKSRLGWIMMNLIPGVFFVLFYFLLLYPIIIYKREWYLHLPMIAAIIVVTVVYIGVFYTFNRLTYYIKVENDNEKAETKLNYWKQQIEIQDATINKIKEIRHDSRHHYTLLLELLEQNNIDKAKEYLNELGIILDKEKITQYCQNYTINCILTAYIAVAEKQNIEVDCKTNIPQNIDIDEVELSGLMANLIENATEACLNIQSENIKKYIHIITQYQTGCLRISVENSCNPGVQFKDGYPITTKEKSSNLGTKSIASIASKYDGMVDFSENNGVFLARVILNIKI